MSFAMMFVAGCLIGAIVPSMYHSPRQLWKMALGMIALFIAYYAGQLA